MVEADMPGKMHSKLGELAWLSLPEKDQKAWKLSTAFPDSAPDFIRSEPTPRTVTEKIACYSHFLDLMGCCRNYPEYLLPGCKAVPHGMADHELNQCMTSSYIHDQESTRIVLREFISRATVEVKNGRMEDAALFAGLISHFLQDAAALGHIFPNSMFYDFSPEETDKHYNYHEMIDYCDPQLTTVKPQILGATLPECVFTLAMLIEKNIQYGKRIFFKLLDACRKSDRKLMNKLTAPMLQNSIFQTASLWKTLLYIGKPASKNMAYDLTNAVPYNCHPGGQYRSIMLNHNVLDGKLVPLIISFSNQKKVKEKGIGLTSFFSAKYLLEPGAFDFFTGIAGLSAAYPEDQEKEMDVEFFISLSDSYNRRTSGELDYGKDMKKVYSLKLVPGMKAEKFIVKLNNAKTLLIAARCKPVKKNDGSMKYHFPHIVLVEPKLIKNTVNVK